jgi:hypothetical protein
VEIGCRLQEGVPPCSSGMAEKETLSENWDPRNLWTAQGVGHRWNEDNSSCNSGMAKKETLQKK